MSTQDSDRSSKRVCLGKIVTAHGIKGLVKLLVHADDPRTLDAYGPVYTGDTGEKTLSLTLKNSMGKYWLAEIEGISTRTDAENLRGTELWVNRDKLSEPDEDEFYIDDLIGLRAVDKDGVEIGKIIAVPNFGASDLLEIKPPSTPSFYLPYIDDNILETDLDNKTMTIQIPEGLLDL